MRLARLPLLLAALLAPAVTASIARAQAKDQKAPTAQTPSRAGQVQADDIIDRMSKAERAVLERLRTSHPLMEVYIQNVAPDEARGWVPTDDNYFLGQLQFDDGPTLRPFGQKERAARGDAAHPLEPAQPGGCLRRDGGARLAGARPKAIRIHVRPPGVPRRIALLRLRRQAASRRQGGLRRPDLDRGSRLQPRPLQRRQPRIGRDVVRRAQADAVVPYGRLACERRARRVGAVVRLLGRNGSEQRIVRPSRPPNRSGKPGSRARRGSGDTRLKTPTGPAR